MGADGRRALTVGGEAVPFEPAKFGPQATTLPPTTALLADPLRADMALMNAAELAGKVAVVQRGNDPKTDAHIPFYTRAWRAQQAGALAVIIVHNESDTPCTFVAADDSSTDEERAQCAAVTIPAICVGKADGKRLLLGADGPAGLVAFRYRPLSPAELEAARPSSLRPLACTSSYTVILCPTADQTRHKPTWSDAMHGTEKLLVRISRRRARRRAGRGCASRRRGRAACSSPASWPSTPRETSSTRAARRTRMPTTSRTTSAPRACTST